MNVLGSVWIFLIEDPSAGAITNSFVSNLKKTLGIAEKKEIDISALGFKPRFKKI